ncbi:MAG: pyruvate kinase [Desulfobia sp.]
MRPFRNYKTKIICTIGPTSESPGMPEELISAGMDIARLNFSHGSFTSHRKNIEQIRKASRKTGKRVAIMGDLPGPKIRIGRLAFDSVELSPGKLLNLSVDSSADGDKKIFVNFAQLPQRVKPGDRLFLNDGLIQLKVKEISDNDVQCQVEIGGELHSHKGVNLPGVSLGISAFTDNDRQWLEFAAEERLDAVSQSFVESPADVQAVRETASTLDYQPFLIAKIERAGALDNIDEILSAADGIMIARGDLGVEVPVETIAVTQKKLIKMANHRGKPVITATQMLESMVSSPRPTRAEVTDVSNAVLDGTDCVMLSGESAIGVYPLEAVRMLIRIARVTEPIQTGYTEIKNPDNEQQEKSLRDLVAWSVQAALRHIAAPAVFTPTQSGATARSIARFRPPVWILAVSSQFDTCQKLQFSYGVYPVHEPVYPKNYKSYARAWLREHGLRGDTVLLTEGPSPRHPEANHRLEIIDLRL